MSYGVELWGWVRKGGIRKNYDGLREIDIQIRLLHL